MHLEDLEHADDIGGTSNFESALVDTLFVHTALLELEDEHRDVITLLDLEGRSVQEVSDILGIPVGTVKSRAARGREAFKVIVLKVLATNGNQTEVSNVVPLGVKNGKKR
jgi:RNA polymerase sigma-70 factor (ECF subfamily)